jgi:HK97 family phage major capsid protein
MPNAQPDERLFQVRSSGLNETIPSDGGFLVQQDFSNELLQSVYQTGILSARCRRVPISGNANGMAINGIDETSRVTGSRYGSIVAYWLGEGDEKTPSKPKFRRIELRLKKLIGLCYATDELLQDAAALDATIRGAFNSEFGWQIDNVIVNGTGAGQPLGMLNAGSLITVDKEVGQKAATIIAENVMRMYSRLLPGSERTAVWLYNKNALPQLMQLSIAVGTGGIPIWMPANALAGQPYNSLLGCPVIPIEQCASVGTVGDLILADLPNGYVLAEKGGIQTDVSIHVRFIYDEQVFRFVLRTDGQPVLAKAITPANGGAGATQSHFIALQTRS